MAQKRDSYSPCSDRDVRAAALRSAHERMREMDNKGQPTVGKLGVILREERAEFQAFGAHMANKGTCSLMTWVQYKEAVQKFAKKKMKGD